MQLWEQGGFTTYPAENIVRGIPLPQDSLIALAYWRHQRRQVRDVGLSMLGSWDGRHRSGKSLGATTAGYLMDPTFWANFDKRVVRDHKEFFDAWEEIDRKKIFGAVVQVDEAGVSMASSDWYEAWLKSISKMVQMFGYLRPIVFFCAPVKDFVDNRLRRMFQNYYRVKRFNKEYSVYRPYDVDYNPFKSKPIYRNPKLSILDKDVYITRIIIEEPPAFIVEKYQEFENTNKPTQLRGFKEEMLRAEQAGQKKEVDLNKAIEYVSLHYKTFEGDRSKPDNPVLNVTHVQFFFKVPTRTALYISDMAKKKLREDYKIKMESALSMTKKESGKDGKPNSV